jgi:hypothetical protein
MIPKHALKNCIWYPEYYKQIFTINTIYELGFKLL